MADIVWSILYVLPLTVVGIYSCFGVLYKCWVLTRTHWSRSEWDAVSYLRFYFCAVMQALYKSRGVFHPCHPGEAMMPTTDEGANSRRDKALGIFYPPDEERVVITDCWMKHDKLKGYRDCINYSGEPDQIPPCFLSGYFNKILIATGSSQYSRIRILGVIHMRQEVSVYRDLRCLLDNPFTISMVGSEYRRTDKGIEADTKAEVRDHRGLLVWEAKFSGLSMMKTKRRKQNNTGNRPVKAPVDIKREVMITAAEDIGIRYARFTDDWQPQHLNKWTAKLVGFDTPIAHGMWTLAVVVDRIMFKESCYKDVYPLHIRTSFKRPLILPGQGQLQYSKPDDSCNRAQFEVVKPGTSVPIIVGDMYTGEKQED